MANENAQRDSNRQTVMLGVTNDSNKYTTELRVDGSTLRLLASTIVTGTVSMADGSGNALSSTTGSLNVNITGGSSSGTQYTDGSSTVAHPVGTIPVYDNAGTVSKVGTSNGLPIQVVGTPAVTATLQTQTDTVMVGGVNIKEINAVAPLMGNGVTGTGSLRVTLASDTTANSNPFLISGAAASGASASGNVLRTGGLGRTTLPTSVSSAQMVDVLLDRYGRVYTVKPVVSNASSGGTAITTNTNTLIVAAPSAGNHLRIHSLWAQNSSATSTWCYWGNGSGVKTFPFSLAQNQPFSRSVDGKWELSSATGLYLNTATTGANIEWFVEYETLTD